MIQNCNGNNSKGNGNVGIYAPSNQALADQWPDIASDKSAVWQYRGLHELLHCLAIIVIINTIRIILINFISILFMPFSCGR